METIPPGFATGPPITTHSRPSLTTEPAIITETAVTTQALTQAMASTTTARPPLVTVTVSPITSSGTATAGESYRLECTITVTGSTDQPTITWLMNSMITSGVVTNGGLSTLTFNPLAASHAGTYTCRATLGSAMDSASTTIIVQSE